MSATQSNFSIEQVPQTVPFRVAYQLLGVSRTKAYALAKAGKFPVPVQRIGDSLLVLRTDLKEYLKVDEL